MVSFKYQQSYMLRVIQLFVILVLLIVSTSFVISNEQLANCDNLKIDTIIQRTTDGLDNGSVDILVSGGEEPYSFTWYGEKRNKGIDNREVANQSALRKGKYLLVVVDATNCVEKVDIEIE